jgi:hypothetical protein
LFGSFTPYGPILGLQYCYRAALVQVLGLLDNKLSNDILEVLVAGYRNIPRQGHPLGDNKRLMGSAIEEVANNDRRKPLLSW